MHSHIGVRSETRAHCAVGGCKSREASEDGCVPRTRPDRIPGRSVPKGRPLGSGVSELCVVCVRGGGVVVGPVTSEAHVLLGFQAIGSVTALIPLRFGTASRSSRSDFASISLALHQDRPPVALPRVPCPLRASASTSSLNARANCRSSTTTPTRLSRASMS